jgi:hypothetical protein
MRDLHQIKYEILNAGSTDVMGEWTIEDLGLFHSTDPFSRVWLMWETIKRFCSVFRTLSLARRSFPKLPLKRRKLSRWFPAEADRRRRST